LKLFIYSLYKFELLFICYLINKMGIGDWGLGIGDWGFGPNPKTPNPKTQTPNPKNK
jgi:hypothetical protein